MSDSAPDSTEPWSPSDLRELNDPRTLRALSHPVRIAIIEALILHGPLTATQVGEKIAESATTCSFHLRQLAKYGFVEEAGGGKGRARPWKLVTIGMRFGDANADPETQVAAGVLGQLFRERQLAHYWSWRQTRSNFPVAWQNAAADSEYLLHLTLEELTDLNEELLTMLHNRYRERALDPSTRPSGSIPIEVLLFTYPIELPSEDS
jgi:predicted ArsR family transcriptional regulator